MTFHDLSFVYSNKIVADSIIKCKEKLPLFLFLILHAGILHGIEDPGQKAYIG